MTLGHCLQFSSLFNSQYSKFSGSMCIYHSSLDCENLTFKFQAAWRDNEESAWHLLLTWFTEEDTPSETLSTGALRERRGQTPHIHLLSWMNRDCVKGPPVVNLKAFLLSSLFIKVTRNSPPAVISLFICNTAQTEGGGGVARWFNQNVHSMAKISLNSSVRTTTSSFFSLLTNILI